VRSDNISGIIFYICKAGKSADFPALLFSQEGDAMGNNSKKAIIFALLH